MPESRRALIAVLVFLAAEFTLAQFIHPGVAPVIAVLLGVITWLVTAPRKSDGAG